MEALRLDFFDIPESERASLLADVPFFDREGVHDVYRKWRAVLGEYSGDRMAVGEAFVYPSSRAARYVRSGELNQVFNFNFMMLGWDAVAMRASIDRTLDELIDVKAPATWVLNNHDTPRVVTRIGGARKARALAMLIHALPGSIYIIRVKNSDYQALICQMKPDKIQHLSEVAVPIKGEMRAEYLFHGIHSYRTMVLVKRNLGCLNPMTGLNTASMLKKKIRAVVGLFIKRALHCDIAILHLVAPEQLLGSNHQLAYFTLLASRALKLL